MTIRLFRIMLGEEEVSELRVSAVSLLDLAVSIWACSFALKSILPLDLLSVTADYRWPFTHLYWSTLPFRPFSLPAFGP